MSKIYGYARCSTDATRQDINRQKRELKELGASEKNIYWEYESGDKSDRTQLNRLLDNVREGDSIVITEVSRLTRSTKQLCDILNMVQQKKIRLIIGTFSVDCRNEEIDPMTKGMLMMWGVFAEMERDMISQRVRSGMANARAKGKKIGRPRLTAENLPSKFYRYYPVYKSGKISVTDFSKLLGCTRKTIYNYLSVRENS